MSKEPDDERRGVSLDRPPPLLKWLIPAIGANAAIAGLNSTALHSLTRRVIRSPLVILQIGSYSINVFGLSICFELCPICSSCLRTTQR